MSIDRALVAVLDERLRAAPNATLCVGAGLRVDDDGLELVAPSTGPESDAPALVRAFRPAPGARRAHIQFWRVHEHRVYPRPTLDLGLDPDGGCIAALLDGPDAIAVDEILLVGPRMERWRPAQGLPPPVAPLAGDARFSRYAGALGGADVLERLHSLSFAVVGCARLGSAIATALARAGVWRLVLVDGDVLEPHSIDAVEAASDAVGRAKVDAVADGLRRANPAVDVVPLPLPVESARAFAQVAACDVVVTAPDDNRARLVAALAAAAYGRPHLDIGAGVFGAATDDFDAGADVRLCLPRQGCLFCFGGLDLARRAPATDFRRQRAGSLRSLNQCAAGQAMLLLERFVAGEVESSAWVRLEVQRNGALATEILAPPQRPDCPVCGRWSGMADAVLVGRDGLGWRT